MAKKVKVAKSLTKRPVGKRPAGKRPAEMVPDPASGRAGIIPAGRPGVPNPIDIHVGGRVRLRRTILGLSQERLGEMIGLTFQQVQKYERGTNRIGASRLYDLSRVLEVPIQFFYDDMAPDVANQSPRLRAGLSEQSPPAYVEADPMSKGETLELVRAFYRIKDPAIRQRLFDLCRAMAHATEEREPGTDDS